MGLTSFWQRSRTWDGCWSRNRAFVSRRGFSRERLACHPAGGPRRRLSKERFVTRDQALGIALVPSIVHDGFVVRFPRSFFPRMPAFVVVFRQLCVHLSYLRALSSPFRHALELGDLLSTVMRQERLEQVRLDVVDHPRAPSSLCPSLPLCQPLSLCYPLSPSVTLSPSPRGTPFPLDPWLGVRVWRKGGRGIALCSS